MPKSILFIIVALIFTALGFSFAKYCPIGVKLGPTQANAQSAASDPTEAQLVSSLMSALYTARSQIEGYKAQHNGNYPEFAKYGWKQLTYKTNTKGQISERGKELGGSLFGPYFQSPPQNPLTKSTEVLVVPTIPENFSATGTYGFVFSEDTGRLFALTRDGKILPDPAAPADAR